MKHSTALCAGLALTVGATAALADTSILFIGNSFTFGYGSATRHYRADTVTDLNGEGIGGVPALFKSFADQTGLDFDVYLETRGGSGLDFHLAEKLDIINHKPWDVVVMHGYSTLDAEAPANPAKLVDTTARMTQFLQQLNPQVDVYLTSTWSRADQTYVADRPWTGKPIAQMAIDLRNAYDQAAAAAPGVKSVNAVGEAWTRAMESGLADSNPYDGIDAGKVNLWTWDHYHASSYGYYLEALVVFGNVTGRDPRSLGDNECSAYELGMSRAEVQAMQQIAFEQLASENRVAAAPAEATGRAAPAPCNSTR